MIGRACDPCPRDAQLRARLERLATAYRCLRAAYQDTDAWAKGVLGGTVNPARQGLAVRTPARGWEPLTDAELARILDPGA